MVMFEKGNKIPYFQYFSIEIGVPHDVDFRITEEDGTITTLVADGYGSITIMSSDITKIHVDSETMEDKFKIMYEALTDIEDTEYGEKVGTFTWADQITSNEGCDMEDKSKIMYEALTDTEYGEKVGTFTWADQIASNEGCDMEHSGKIFTPEYFKDAANGWSRAQTDKDRLIEAMSFLGDGDANTLKLIEDILSNFEVKIKK